MKTFALIILLGTGLPVFAQWGWNKIEGNGNIKKETRNVGSFTAIASSGSWDVMIANGESNTIQVEGDENLLSYLETKVDNGKLIIKTASNTGLKPTKKLTIYVALNKLTGISLSGSGDIIGQGKFYNDGEASFKLSGSGNIQLSSNKFNAADVAISGSGKIILSGSSEKVKISISGSGNVDCSQLVSDDIDAAISGSGDIKVFANKSINAKISGSGTVYYKGAATAINTRKSGSGKVVHQ